MDLVLQLRVSSLAGCGLYRGIVGLRAQSVFIEVYSRALEWIMFYNPVSVP